MKTLVACPAEEPRRNEPVTWTGTTTTTTTGGNVHVTWKGVDTRR